MVSTISSAPLVDLDADDIAELIKVLNLQGSSTSPVRMIETFEVTNYFKTYLTERDPIFTANCNVLGALPSVKAAMDRYAP